jgi:glucose-6-phosphate isomerase
MMDTSLTIDEKAQSCAKKYGVVTYTHSGMHAPAGMADKGPYVTDAALKEAMALASAQTKLLRESSDEAKKRDPETFLALRDEGHDTQGLAGKPVMTGWLTYAGKTLQNTAFIEGLKKAGEKIRSDFSALLVIGIGGSYTDIEGVISALNPLGAPLPVCYLGQHLSAEAYARFFKTIEKLPGKVAVNIISKSGTTVEPALAARIVLDKLISMKKLGAVFATTDAKKGALRELVATKGYNRPEYLPPEVEKEFYIGEDIGGRFSCITPVGLLPYAVSGIDIEEFLLGYHYAMRFSVETANQVAAYRYAAWKRGATLAVFSYNVSCFRGKILAYRQLWPESTGKDGKGLNIMEEFYTSDAHSNGQLIKSGIRNMMEIFHFIDDIGANAGVPVSEYNSDKLNTVAGKLTLHEINNRFMGALFLDHYKSGVPVTAVKIPGLSAFPVAMQNGIEYLAAAIFGLMTGINPVNQPGVQGYKEIAFNLLGFKGDAAMEKAVLELKEFGIG